MTNSKNRNYESNEETWLLDNLPFIQRYEKDFLASNIIRYDLWYLWNFFYYLPISPKTTDVPDGGKLSKELY